MSVPVINDSLVLKNLEAGRGLRTSPKTFCTNTYQCSPSRVVGMHVVWRRQNNAAPGSPEYRPCIRVAARNYRDEYYCTYRMVGDLTDSYGCNPRNITISSVWDELTQGYCRHMGMPRRPAAWMKAPFVPSVRQFMELFVEMHNAGIEFTALELSALRSITQ